MVQYGYPIEVTLLENNPYGKTVKINNINLYTDKSILIYTQEELNKLELLEKYIKIKTVIKEDDFDVDEIDDTMIDSSSD